MGVVKVLVHLLLKTFFAARVKNMSSGLYFGHAKNLRETFYKHSYRINRVNYFRKKFHEICLTGS